MIPHDGEEIDLHANQQEWRLSWHPPTQLPTGKAHGSAGICVTAANEIVLVSGDGARWDLPAGRPEGAETWEQTLRREVHEEACAIVGEARLLGFSRGRCVRGHEEGLVLVRSFWLAEVLLEPWEPKFEILHRKVVPQGELFANLTIEHGYLPILRRALDEAGFN
jgi:ADP-ribose pyrophosphatase YjhB (NUDIX family)